MLMRYILFCKTLNLRVTEKSFCCCRLRPRSRLGQSVIQPRNWRSFWARWNVKDRCCFIPTKKLVLTRRDRLCCCFLTCWWSTIYFCSVYYSDILICYWQWPGRWWELFEKQCTVIFFIMLGLILYFDIVSPRRSSR